MYIDTAMQVLPSKETILVKDLVQDYVTEAELSANKALTAYAGRLCIRPEYQRSFVYKDKQAEAVINSILLKYPLNNFYWTDNEDGTYGCMDGQQRTISICEFVCGYSHVEIEWLKALNNNQMVYVHDLERKFPKLYTRLMEYPLSVQVCSHGTKDELANFFLAINTNGEKLSDQELRNANYVGKWLTDAKRYFSKSRANAAASPAERISQGYVPTNLKAERQEYLELALQWIVNSTKNADICEYMQAHYKDNDAKELREYFETVINWVKEIFPEIDHKFMKNDFWGKLYASYGNKDYDPDEMMEIFNTLINNNEELEHVSIRKKFEFCFTRDTRLLTHRLFSSQQRAAMYNIQKGICPDCKKHFEMSEMEAHHIKPWFCGGRTDTNNGVMLCPSCHTNRQFPSIYSN